MNLRSDGTCEHSKSSQTSGEPHLAMLPLAHLVYHLVVAC